MPQLYSEKNTLQTNKISELHILLVEDNLINQNMVAMILKKRGAHVIVANNGQEALDILTSKKVDVILMDIQMPILDGYQTTQKIRELEKNKSTRTPIIALTANALNNEREHCIAQGMDGYLCKPFGMQELLNCITNTLHRVNSKIN